MDSAIVLEGEIAWSQARKQAFSPPPPIKTSAPSYCHVLTFHSKEHKFGVMTHINTLTSVESVFQVIDKIAADQFGKTFSEMGFEVSLFGGRGDNIQPSSHRILIEEGLKTRDLIIHNNFSLLGMDKQITLDVLTGDTKISPYEDIDWRLEYLQLRERVNFNNLINEVGDRMEPSDFCEETQTALSKGLEPFEFYVKKAIHREEVLDSIPRCKGLIELEGEELIKKKFSTSHLVHKEHVCTKVLPEFHKLLTHKICKSFVKDEPSLRALHSKQDFNGLLRRVPLFRDASRELLLEILLSYAPILGIDVHSVDKESGKTALDIAVENGNEEAIKLIQRYTPVIEEALSYSRAESTV